MANTYSENTERKAQILIVEDEIIIAMALENNLKSIGYEVMAIVDSGEKAMAILENKRPDLIIMDIRIKGETDGIETAELIWSKFEIAVVFSTAYLDEERLERAKLAMPFGYVLKPIQERELRVTIEMALYVAKIDAARRKAEFKSLESATQYQVLFNSMLDGFALHEMIYDEQGKPADYRFLRINKAFEMLTGLKAKDVIGKTLLEVLPNSEKYWIEKYGNVALTGDPIRFENYSQDLERHYEVNAYRPEENQFACVFKDITQQKKAMEQFKLSDDIVNNILVGFHVYHLEDIKNDKTLRMISSNSSSENITGMANDEIIGRTLDESFPGFREKGIPQACAEVIRSGKPMELEDIYYGDEHGNDSWYSIKAFPLSNQSVGVAFENITKRKKSENELIKAKEDLQNIIDSSSANIRVKNLKGEYVLISKKFEKEFGISIGDMIGKTDFDFLPKETAEKYREQDLNVVKTKQQYTMEEEFRQNDKVQSFWIHKNPLINKDGEIYGILVESINLTNRKGF